MSSCPLTLMYPPPDPSNHRDVRLYSVHIWFLQGVGAVELATHLWPLSWVRGGTAWELSPQHALRAAQSLGGSCDDSRSAH